MFTTQALGLKESINKRSVTCLYTTDIPDVCQKLCVSRSIHSLFSRSTNCLITTSYPLQLGALCIKATVALPWASSLNSRSGGPSCDSSTTLLTKTSLLPRVGERILGLHNEHAISNGFVSVPLQNVTDAAASWRFQISRSRDISPLKNHNVMIRATTMFQF